MSFIPVIDLAPATGDLAARQGVAAAIGRACEDIGFFMVTAHGVSDATIADAWRAALGFFDLPLSGRRSVQVPYAGYPYGYIPYLAETLAHSLGQASPPDRKETYAIGPLEQPSMPPADPDAAFAYAANLWPANPAGFRAAWEAYYHALSALAARLMRLFALALGLDESYFDPTIDRHISALRAAHYPHHDAPAAPGQLRAGAHADYGSLAILLQDTAPGGLEVQTRDGAWRPVPAVPGTFVINLGDLMARWTNDRWVSTMHRVANPPPDAHGSTRRLSIAFFHTPNWDARIECIETCLAPGARPKYPAIGAGTYLMAKHRSTVDFNGDTPDAR